MRLTKQIKKDVVRHLVRQTYQKQLDKQLQSIASIIDSCVKSVLISTHNKALEIESTHKDLLVQHNRAYGVNGVNTTVPSFPLLSTKSFHFTGFGIKRLASTPICYYVDKFGRSMASVEVTGKRKEKIQNKLIELSNLHDEYTAFVRDITSVIESFTTDKQLIEVFPQAKTALPEPVKKLPIPVETISKVQQKLREAA